MIRTVLSIPAGKDISTPLAVYAALRRSGSKGTPEDAPQIAEGLHTNGPIFSGAGSVLVSATDGVEETHGAVAETVIAPAILLVLSKMPARPPSTATVTGFPESVRDVLWPP